MICKNCGKEIQDGVAFCSSCGAKVDEVPVNNPNVVPASEQPKENGQIASQNFKSNQAANPADKTKVKNTTKPSAKKIFVALLGGIGAISILLSIIILIFDSGIEVDYGDFKSNEQVSLSGFTVDYNEDISYLTVKVEITAKVDCKVGISVYFDVYNEYDRAITTCRIVTDALKKDEKYTFNDMYQVDSGSKISKIVIKDVVLF